MVERESKAPEKGRRSLLAEERTQMALRRTVLAADRTLLAWVRTSLSLMTFGFTVYKFFQYLDESGAISGEWKPTGPRRFGLILVGLATILLAAQTVQYYQLLRRSSRVRRAKLLKTPALVAGIAVTLLGILAFLSILLGIRLF